jgi:hypothetical protein
MLRYGCVIRADKPLTQGFSIRLQAAAAMARSTVLHMYIIICRPALHSLRKLDVQLRKRVFVTIAVRYLTNSCPAAHLICLVGSERLLDAFRL